MTFSITEPIKFDTDTINKIAIKTAEIILSGKSTQQPEPQNDLITSKQACEVLQCSSVTLWRYEKRRRIQSYGISGKKWFKRSELLNSIVKK